MPQLTDVDVEFVSLVDRAAVRDPVKRDQPNRFLLWKRDQPKEGDRMTTLTKELLDQLGAPVAKEDDLKTYIEKSDASEDVTAALQGAARLLATHKSDLPHDALLELAKAAGVELRLEKAGPKLGSPEWDEKYGTGKKKPAPKDAAELVASLKKSDVAESVIAEVEGALAKAAEKAEIDKADLPPAVKAALAKADADRAEDHRRIEKAEADTKAERDLRLTKEFVTKAEGFEGLSIKPEDFGPVLKAAAGKLTKAEYEALENLLKAADEQIQKGDLFAEAGAAGVGGPDGAFAEATRKAQELRKADSELTDSGALDKAFRDDPELQARYLAETRA